MRKMYDDDRDSILATMRHGCEAKHNKDVYTRLNLFGVWISSAKAFVNLFFNSIRPYRSRNRIYGRNTVRVPMRIAELAAAYSGFAELKAAKPLRYRNPIADHPFRFVLSH